MEFEKFPKMGRAFRNIIVTEKIDGTNAQVYIEHRSNIDPEILDNGSIPFFSVDDYVMVAGSRNRWLSEKSDNYGFGKWVSSNREELLSLGVGRHYGEWWGQGIQRRYGLDHKRFSLFNTSRWDNESLPSCCHVVPVMYIGEMHTDTIRSLLISLRDGGSLAAPGFMKPEGICIYHSALKTYMKATIEHDELPKSLVIGE